MKTRMPSSRMHTARLCIVRWGGEPGPMSMSGQDRGCCDQVPCPCLGGGGCCDQVSCPCPGGVCCDQVPCPCPGGGRGCCVKVPCPCQGGGGVVTWSMVHFFPPPPPPVEVTHACENITFTRFATRTVKIDWSILSLSPVNDVAGT